MTKLKKELDWWYYPSIPVNYLDEVSKYKMKNFS